MESPYLAIRDGIGRLKRTNIIVLPDYLLQFNLTGAKCTFNLTKATLVLIDVGSAA